MQNGGKILRWLFSQQHGHTDRSPCVNFKQFIRRFEVPHTIDSRYIDVGKSGVRQKFYGGASSCKLMEIGSRGYRNVRMAVGPDCSIHSCKTRRGFRSAPNCHRELSTLAKHAPSLLEGAWLIGNLPNAEISSRTKPVLFRSYAGCSQISANGVLLISYEPHSC